jgi:hypothetical protein
VGLKFQPGVNVETVTNFLLKLALLYGRSKPVRNVNQIRLDALD